MRAATKLAVAPDPTGAIIKAGVRIAVLLHASKGLRHRERYSIGVKRGFETACWRFLPPHRIWLGSRMLEGARSGLSVAQMEEYAALYVRHEFGHMAFTAKAITDVLLAGVKPIPKGLLNIFEDARMEECERRATDEKFNWLRYEEPWKVSSPSSLLLAMVQNEGPMRSPRGPEPSAEVWAVADEVADFYLEACRAPQTQDLVPIIQRWMERFPEPEENVAQPRDCLSLLCSPDELAEEVAELDKDTEKLEVGPRSSEKVEIESEGNADLLLPEGAINNLIEPLRVRAETVATHLSKLFLRPVGLVSNENPSRRVNVRSGPAMGNASWQFLHKDRPRVKPYDVGVVFDLSGSMNGTPLVEGLVLLEALSILARRGLARGWVVLSAVHGRHSMHQRFKLPLDHSVLERFHAFGSAEGLQSALMAHADELRKMSQVLVYTDADICDRPLDRPALQKRGLSPIGLYVGEEDNAAKLPTHFKEYLVRPTVEQLVEAMVARFRVRKH
jgi:hypothetical protein